MEAVEIETDTDSSSMASEDSYSDDSIEFVSALQHNFIFYI